MFARIGRLQGAVLLSVLLGLLVSSCASSRLNEGGAYHGHRRYTGNGYVKDNRPGIWSSNQYRVAQFREHYRRTKTVQTALEAGARYLPAILPAFEKRNLPPELASLPMLESNFENMADPGHARQ